MRSLLIPLTALVVSTVAASAADYRDAPDRPSRHAHHHAYPAPFVPITTGIRPARPLFIVEAPPRYVQDVRIGAPGQWVVREPGLAERLFGLRTDLSY